MWQKNHARASSSLIRVSGPCNRICVELPVQYEGPRLEVLNLSKDDKMLAKIGLRTLGWRRRWFCWHGVCGKAVGSMANLEKELK